MHASDCGDDWALHKTKAAGTKRAERCTAVRVREWRMRGGACKVRTDPPRNLHSPRYTAVAMLRPMVDDNGEPIGYTDATNTNITQVGSLPGTISIPEPMSNECTKGSHGQSILGTVLDAEPTGNARVAVGSGILVVNAAPPYTPLLCNPPSTYLLHALRSRQTMSMAMCMGRTCVCA